MSMIDLSAVTVQMTNKHGFSMVFPDFVEIAQLHDLKTTLVSRGVPVRGSEVHWVNYLAIDWTNKDQYFYFAVKDFELAKAIKLETGLSPEIPAKVFFTDKRSFQFGFSNAYPNYQQTINKICTLIAKWEFSLKKQNLEILLQEMDKAYC